MPSSLGLNCRKYVQDFDIYNPQSTYDVYDQDQVEGDRNFWIYLVAKLI